MAETPGTTAAPEKHASHEWKPFDEDDALEYCERCEVCTCCCAEESSAPCATERDERPGVPSIEASWAAWSPRLTDLTKPAPAYFEAFRAGWAAAGGTEQGENR